MITGVHTLIYSTNPEADRAFFRDVLHFGYTDAGDGWLIFGLPTAELGIHPADECEGQAIYLICEDVEAFVQEMMEHGIRCTPIQSQSWGTLTQITLPGGSTLGVYQASHPRPEPRQGGR